MLEKQRNFDIMSRVSSRQKPRLPYWEERRSTTESEAVSPSRPVVYRIKASKKRRGPVLKRAKPIKGTNTPDSATVRQSLDRSVRQGVKLHTIYNSIYESSKQRVAENVTQLHSHYRGEIPSFDEVAARTVCFVNPESQVE